MSATNEKAALTPAEERQYLGLSIALGSAVLLLDQWTKMAVIQSFMLHESRVIGKFFSLTYVENLGAAWSMFQGCGVFLVAIAVIVVLGALFFLRSLTECYPERYAAIFLVIGGICGNTIDRIWRGAVVDFLDFHCQSWHWPVFNVADIAICTGVGIFLLSSLLRKSSAEKETENSAGE